VNYDDETLMAYADGELNAPRSAEIAAAAERDPALQRRIERHRMLRARLSGAFATVLDQPVPERMVAAARGTTATDPVTKASRRGEVLQFPTRGARMPGTAWRGREWGAMAASVLLGVVISWKLFAPAEPELLAARGGALVARGPLAAALEQQLASLQRPEDGVLIGVTFKARDGSYCRSFTLRATRTAGLACRVDENWQVAVTAAADAPTGDLRQAASMPPAVLEVIEARIDAQALDAAGEENAQRSGWHPKR
jgi:hypothetical protein